MKFIQSIKIPILIPVILLAFFSLLTLASLSANDSSAFLIFQKQIVWYILGLVVFFLISKYFNSRLLQNNIFFSMGFYLACLIFLVLVLFLGTTIKGATGWFNFSFFSFQPVELAKVALIILLAKYFAVWHVEHEKK